VEASLVLAEGTAGDPGMALVGSAAGLLGLGLIFGTRPSCNGAAKTGIWLMGETGGATPMDDELERLAGESRGLPGLACRKDTLDFPVFPAIAEPVPKIGMLAIEPEAA